MKYSISTSNLDNLIRPKVGKINRKWIMVEETLNSCFMFSGCIKLQEPFKFWDLKDIN